MPEIVNTFLLESDKFMPEIHISQNKLDKAFFPHDTAYGDFKDLPRRTAYEKVLREKHLMLHLKSTI